MMDEDTNHRYAKYAIDDRCVSIAEFARKDIGRVAHSIGERSWRGKERSRPLREGVDPNGTRRCKWWRGDEPMVMLKRR